MASRRTRVYVAGPYTSDPEYNVERAINAASELLSRDYAPFIPHLTHFWDERYPQKYEVWMAYDLEWVGACDALVRLSGESKGADREVEHAKSLNLPVYYSLDSLCASEKPTICLGIDPWSTTTSATASGIRCTEPSSTTRTGWK